MLRRFLGDPFLWIMKILGYQPPILGDQAPWWGGLLRLLALTRFLRRNKILYFWYWRKRIVYFWHNIDAPWVNTGSSKVMWKNGYSPPSYFSTVFQVLGPISDSVQLSDSIRQTLKAPLPWWWLIGPPTDITIAAYEKELMKYLDEMINILNDWYSQLATWARYQFIEIPKPSESGSILNWVITLGGMIGIDRKAVVYTTSLAFFSDPDRQKQIRKKIANEEGEWWAIDVNTFRRSEWYKRKSLPEEVIFVPKARRLLTLLVKEWGYPVYATYLPYVDDLSLYRSIILEISEDDKEKLIEALMREYLKKKRARGEDFDPKIGITPDRPDALSFLALGYKVKARVKVRKGKFVSLLLERGS